MSDLEYGPLQSGDIASIQAIVQGAQYYCSIEFNDSSLIGFAARARGRFVGFMSGSKGSGDNSSTVTLSAPFLYHAFNDASHAQEMHLAFINWAAEEHHITHYRTNTYETPRPIGIDHLIPETPEPVAEEQLAREFAYA